MSFWNIKLYDSERTERETIRHLSRPRKDDLMSVFDRLGAQAQAMKYDDTGAYVQGSGESVNWPDPIEELRHRIEAEELGVLFGKACANFDTLGEFMAAINNSMSGRLYEWDRDRFSAVLQHFIDHDIGENPPHPHFEAGEA